jgi:hypothetical protein
MRQCPEHLLALRTKGFKPLKEGRIHFRCPVCGRKQSNMKRDEYDPEGAFLYEVACDKAKCSGGCKDLWADWFDAKGNKMPDKETNHEFQKVLTVSTAHITEADRRLLEDPFCEILKADFYYGWFVWVDEPIIYEEAETDFSEAFVKLLNYAHKLKCNWIQLDCDGPTYSDLQTFNW